MKTIRLILPVILVLILLTSCATPATTTMATTEVPTESSEALPVVGEPRMLFPAFERAEGQQAWGYIDQTGVYIIPPQYEMTTDFQAIGLSVFRQKGKTGLIDLSGEIIVEPTFDDIGTYSEGIAIALNWGDLTTSTLLDVSGATIAAIDGYVAPFSEDRAVIYDAAAGLYGYVDTAGKMVIEPQFTSAGDFVDRRAKVWLPDGTTVEIDPLGQQLGTPVAEEPFDGYQLMYNKTFDDGLQIIGHTVEYTDTYGLFDASGQTLIAEEYAGIERLDRNLFAAARATEFVPSYQFLPKALFNTEGQQLTDFIYYNLTSAGEALFCATDHQYTYLIDNQGVTLNTFPKLRGNGTVQLLNGLVKAVVDQALSYYTLDGQLVWAENGDETLKSGVTVTRQKFSPSRFLLIYFPKLGGLTSSAVQQQINTDLENFFTDEKQYTNMDGSLIQDGTSYNSVNYTVEQFGDLLVVNKSGYDYPVGAAHGQPYSAYRHYNVQTGATYTLKDLFKSDADYKTRLEQLIAAQIVDQEANDGMYYDTKTPALSEQQFTLKDTALELFYGPYEIAAYAAGFPTFSIPYREIEDLINTEGDLWKALN